MRCNQCKEEETNEEAYADHFFEWQKAATSALLKDIAKKKRTATSCTDAILLCDSDDIDEDSSNEAYLVHSKDVDAWRTALKEAKKYKGSSSLEILMSVFGWSNPSCTSRNLPTEEESKQPAKLAMDSRVDVVGHILPSMTSLTCFEHSLPLERVVFKVDADPKDPCISLVNRVVEPLTPPEYEAFIGSVYDLGVLLSKHTASRGGTDFEEGCELENSPPHITPGILEQFKEMHPKFDTLLKPLLRMLHP